MALLFRERVDELIDMVGGGKLVAKFVMDQRYAELQHERFDYRHPRGSGPKFMTRGLLDNNPSAFLLLSWRVLSKPLRDVMVTVANDVKESIEELTPVELTYLRDSVAITIYDGANKIYKHFPPKQRRLTDRELSNANNYRLLLRKVRAKPRYR